MNVLKLKALFLLLAFLAAAAAWAEPAGDDPLGKYLFPPDLVMKYSQDLGLDERQRTAVKENVQKAQTKFVDLQWELQEATQKMIHLLQARPVDEAAALAAADKVLGLERDIKRTQLSLLIRLKNLLSEPQQAKLTELRKRAE
ncbi:MAG TPA: periplasmic heavy metal sensor [Thermoanaerobaculia bacterium]|jgi:Spy/CpxP family protein refolding chaperone|nr:periplasmic heavy metal sensor [Thermoanaerobaculia bacterium]